MPDVTIRKLDTAPKIKAILKDETGTAINLTGATVKWLMRGPLTDKTKPTKINSAATVTDPTLGKVEYAWAATDTDTAGDFVGRFVVTQSDGSILSCPNSKDKTVRIEDD